MLDNAVYYVQCIEAGSQGKEKTGSIIFLASNDRHNNLLIVAKLSEKYILQ